MSILRGDRAGTTHAVHRRQRRGLFAHGLVLATESVGVLVAVIGLGAGPVVFASGFGVFVLSELTFLWFDL